MKRLFFFLALVSLSIVVFTACNKDDEFYYDIPVSEQVYAYGPQLLVEFHNEQGEDLVEKNEYNKYPQIDDQNYVDGFHFLFYLNGKLISEEKDKSLSVLKSLPHKEQEFEWPGFGALAFGCAEVFELTKDEPLGPHEVKIEFSNELLFSSSKMHTLTYTFTRIDRGEDYHIYRETDKNRPLWNWNTPSYSNVKFDGQPLELKDDHRLAKTRVDVVVK